MGYAIAEPIMELEEAKRVKLRPWAAPLFAMSRGSSVGSVGYP